MRLYANLGQFSRRILALAGLTALAAAMAASLATSHIPGKAGAEGPTPLKPRAGVRTVAVGAGLEGENPIKPRGLVIVK